MNNTRKTTNYKKINNINIVRKKKKKNLYAYADIILIIIIILAVVLFFKTRDNNNNNSENTNSIENEKYYKEENKERYLSYQEKNKKWNIEKIITYVNIGLDQDYYTNVKDSPNKYTNIVLVNKYYYLGEDYVPKNLTKISNRYAISEDKYMEHDAAIAFEDMAKAAQKDGYQIVAVSTYRSYKYQTTLYNNYVSKDGEEKADKYSARPGYSEHQTGLAVDVSNNKKSYTKFGETEEFNWMQDNCYKYGFILRYTEENEFITGYINEPWHYRYVGIDIATYIHNNPMTFEEYYVKFLEK